MHYGRESASFHTIALFFYKNTTFNAYAKINE